MNKYRVYGRAAKDLFRIGKKHYLYYSIMTIARQSMPFIGFIYMRKIIDTLISNRIGDTHSLIIQFICTSLILQLVQGMMQPLVDNEQEISEKKMYAEASRKMLRMHFHHAESTAVKERLENINQMLLSSQSSLPLLSLRFKYVFPSLISIIWGIILLHPLFIVDTAVIPSQFWWVHPGAIITMFVLAISISLFIQVKSSKKSAEALSRTIHEASEWRKQAFYEEKVLEDIKSGKEIRLYRLSGRLLENFQKQHHYLTDIMNGMYRVFRITAVPTNILAQLMSYMIYSFLGLLVLLGALKVGLLVQLSGALSQVITAIPTCIQQLMMMISDPEWLNEYYAFMDLPDEETIGSIPVEKRMDNQYEIAVSNLAFAYPGSEELVLKNITEQFEVGKKYAIVGENGSGKTTFIKLLTRLYEPTEGLIKMNKIDSSKYELREYFNLFGVVFQDYHLLGFSIGQNISVNPDYNHSKVMNTLDEVGLGEFVRTLPKQSDTYLGTEFDDSGMNVSGGQEQKIAIARSLYKDAPIMILDEPTAALDPITEFDIYQNFDNLVKDKTAFYISHRLSSSKFSDEILVFDKGEIVQRGSHKKLVEQDGKYQELWNAQAQYYQ
ncbi:ABC transporter ATP-binding protein [Marinilactibacillus kalidii]|uniref:ABC transporter ATP-binding protein n=1 Tax=Marinilactibacillus kalidii TaxID=2820274 RepID=UPI001ABE5978|nr:ABC transporter ATP-binding protein [Marinilactibacillus kalidii]